jgi:hypothetical protein
MSCHGAIKTSPYHLVYGQEAVLPWEITAGSRRVTFQNDLTTEEYATLMSDGIEDLTELRLWSLEKIKDNKAKVARASYITKKFIPTIYFSKHAAMPPQQAHPIMPHQLFFSPKAYK